MASSTFQTGGIPFPNERGGLANAGRGPGWIGGPPGWSGGGGKGRGVRDEDDERAANDWFCPACRERNFQRRVECFKCGVARPSDAQGGASQGGPAPAKLEVGATMNGMVKSYNRKGWGFLMILGGGHQDMYYTRDNLSPNLETCDIPGRYVSFEVQKMPDGRRTAVSIRPMGEDKPSRPSMFCSRPPAFAPAAGPAPWSKGFAPAAGGKGFLGSTGGFSSGPSLLGFSAASGFRDGGDDASQAEASRRASAEAASRAAGRALSPHAGSRAYALSAMAGRGRSRSSSRKKQKSSKRKSRTSSSGSSSRKSRSSSSSKSKSKRKRKSRRRSRSSSSSSSGVVEVRQADPAPPPLANPEVDKGKAEALAEMLKLRDNPSKDARMSEWRALLRKWHPDKNPDRVEVATTVFQFLQRGKPMLEGA